MEWLDQSKRVLNMGLSKCLDRVKAQGEHCTTKVTTHKRSEGGLKASLDSVERNVSRLSRLQ